MAFSSFFRDDTETLRFHTQGGVEFAGQVLESNQGGQFNDRIIIKVAMQLLEVRWRSPLVRVGHRFGV